MSDERATPPLPLPPPPGRDSDAGVPAFPEIPAVPGVPQPIEGPGTGTDGEPDVVGAPRRTSLLRSSMVMASGTLVSRVLGFARNFLLLACIGTGAGSVSAAFGVANNLPNTVYNLLAAGVFDAVLVPQIVRALKSRSGNVYVNRLITLAGTILFAATMLAMVAAPLLVTLFAKGYSGELRSLSIAFTLLCLPQIFFYGVYNLLGELLNARGIFGPYMWAPVVNNIVGIAGLVAFLVMWGPAPGDGIFHVEDFSSAQFWVLAGSATLGVLLQALVLIIPMRRADVSLRLDFHFRGTSFGTASKVAGWTFATLGISQIGILSTSNLATQVDTFAAGKDVLLAGIASYTTAFMIYMVPQSLISVSLATAIFTRLADAAADRDGETMAANYHQGVRLISLLSLLAAAILMAGAVPMMQLALPPGATPEVARAYSWVLLALMPGVASTGMVLMSQRVFFALEDARPVFLMGIVPTLLQVAVGWSVFALAGPEWWTAGAALGETACRLLQGFIAVFWVARVVREVNPGRIVASYLKFLIAAVASFLVGAGVIQLLGPVSDPGSRLVRYLMAGGKLLLVAVVVTLVYTVVLRLIDPEDSGRVLPALAQRLPLPTALRRVVAGRSGGGDGDNGLTQDGRTTEGAMERDQDGTGPGAPDAERVGEDRVRPPQDHPTEAPATAAQGDEDGPTGTPAGHGEASEATTWSAVGAAWSASDLTNTGEFPAIPRLSVDRLAARRREELPSFDEILRPRDAGGAQVVPPLAPEHEGTEDSRTPPEEHVGPGSRDDGRSTADGDSPEGAPALTPGADTALPVPPPDVPFDAATPGPDTDATSSTQTRDSAAVPEAAAGDAGDGRPHWPHAGAGSDQGQGGEDVPDDVSPDEDDQQGGSASRVPEPEDPLHGPGGVDSPGAAGPSATLSFPPPPAPGPTAGDTGVPAAGSAAAAAVGGAAAGGALQDTGGNLAATAARSFSGWLGRTSQALRNSTTSMFERARALPGDAPAGDGTPDELSAGDGEATGARKGPGATPPADDHSSEVQDTTGSDGTGEAAATTIAAAPQAEDEDTDTTDATAVPGGFPGPGVTGEDDMTAPGMRGTDGGTHTGGDGGHEQVDLDRDRTEVITAAGVARAVPATGRGAGGDGPAGPPSSTSGGGASGTAPRGTGGRRRGLDPTIPALVFAGALVIAGGVWGVNTALSPVGVFDLPTIPTQSGEQSGQQSGEQSGSASEEPGEPQEQDVVTPEIATPTIFSWRDDGGDNPDSVMNMFDGDPNTEWHSRSYSLNQFSPTGTVTILLTLKEEAPVSEITLTMAPETSGGEVVVQDVSDNPADPRTGTELATSALSPQTTITLPEPTEVTALSLSFRTMPTGPNGENWAWIYELAVR